MHIHILGICGTFMGGLALLARAAGHKVSGCDHGVYPPMSTQLAQQGIDLIEGFDDSQLAIEPDLFVIGNVVSRGNPLLEAILDARRPYTSGPQWLGERLLTDMRVLAVAGTHGKTSTSAMLAWILEHAGLQPGFLIGGIPLDFGVSARLPGGTEPVFVIEADEYDTAFFDKRSKFVHYRPELALLNNLEYDHADIFPDLAAIETQFHHLIRCVPRCGKLIVNGDDPALTRVLARGVWTEVEHFRRIAASITTADALSNPSGHDWALVASASDSNSPHCLQGLQDYGSLHWNQSGAHNQLNALAALAAAAHVGISPTVGLAALATFQGVKRRLELRGMARGVSVYDDFAHHPTAIATTVAGLRQRLGNARILAVLEPRSNTMKLGTLRARLAESLREADQVYCYGARSGKDALGWEPAEALAPLGAAAQCFDDIDTLVASLVEQARPGDHILIMSNGGFGGIHERLLNALAS